MASLDLGLDYMTKDADLQMSVTITGLLSRGSFCFSHKYQSQICPIRDSLHRGYGTSIR